VGMRTLDGPLLNQNTLAEVQSLGDGLLQEIVAAFVADAPDRITRLHAAFAAHAADAIKREAHGLKGGALGVGAARIADICQAIESHATNGRVDAAAMFQADVDPAFVETCRALEALCQPRSCA
jgi:two-component system, sensor histidine kinase